MHNRGLAEVQSLNLDEADGGIALPWLLSDLHDQLHIRSL